MSTVAAVVIPIPERIVRLQSCRRVENRADGVYARHEAFVQDMTLALGWDMVEHFRFHDRGICGGRIPIREQHRSLESLPSRERVTGLWIWIIHWALP